MREMLLEKWLLYVVALAVAVIVGGMVIHQVHQFQQSVTARLAFTAK